MSIELIKLFLQQGYEITKPGFLQMYIYDAENEVANRTVSQPGVQLDSDWLTVRFATSFFAS